MTIRQILVIHAGAIGDLVLSLPVLRALRAAHPGARLVLLGRPVIAALALDGQHADAVDDLETRRLSPLFVPGGEIPHDLQAYLASFDLAVPFLDDARGTVARNLARAGCGRVVSLRARPPAAAATHATDRLLARLAAAGIRPTPDPRPALRPPASWFAAGDRFLEEHGILAPPLIVHPGSGSPRKNWPAGAFARAADRLAARRGERVVLASGEAESDAGERLARSLRRGVGIAARGLPLPTLAALLARARLFLGNDSGISHLAAAVGTPTVAIFGPTDPAVWAPRAPRVRIVRGSPLPSGGGIRPDDPTPGTVVRAARELLALGVPRPRLEKPPLGGTLPATTRPKEPR